MARKKIDHKVIDLAKKLGVKIIWTNDNTIRAHYDYGREIMINPNRATNYDVLHEVSHKICGFGCCREHDEFQAHGGAKVLLKLIGLGKGNSESRMNNYAGWSSHKSCGRIEK